MTHMEIDNWDKQDTNALVIVAHPDDETIFMGGTILRYPNWNWKIVCVTHGADSPRSTELREAVEKYKEFGIKNISSINLGLEDSYDSNEAEKQTNQIRERIKSILAEKFDVVFTHNVKGDYGHPQHIVISRVVHELSKMPVWEFVCLGAEKVVPAPFRKYIHLTVLDTQELEQKLNIFESYPSQMSFFRDLPTIARYEFKTGPEIFVSDMYIK